MFLLLYIRSQFVPIPINLFQPNRKCHWVVNGCTVTIGSSEIFHKTLIEAKKKNITVFYCSWSLIVFYLFSSGFKWQKVHLRNNKILQINIFDDHLYSSNHFLFKNRRGVKRCGFWDLVRVLFGLPDPLFAAADFGRYDVVAKTILRRHFVIQGQRHFTDDV